MKSGNWTLLFFGLFWSALTLTFDVVCFRGLLGQVRSYGFARTTGKILSSEVTVEHGGDTTYRASVRYEYSVDGARHESNRVRFGEMGDSAGDRAGRIVRMNPPGAERTLFYNPTDPDEAVLEVGVQGQDLFMMLFLTPFNAVMIGIVYALRTSDKPVPTAGGARVTTERDEVKIWLNPRSPLAVALLTFVGAAFLATFPVGFTSGFTPSLTVMNVTWALVFAVAVATFWISRRRVPRDLPDFVISPTRATFTFTRGFPPKVTDPLSWRKWRTESLSSDSVRLSSIRDIILREAPSQDTENPSPSYAAILLVKETERPPVPEYLLGFWTVEREAAAFVAWLREALRLPRA